MVVMADDGDGCVFRTLWVDAGVVLLPLQLADGRRLSVSNGNNNKNDDKVPFEFVSADLRKLTKSLSFFL